MTSDLEDVKAGSVSGGLVRGKMRSIKWTRPAEKCKGKGNRRKRRARKERKIGNQRGSAGREMG